jgi:hypothetical protein
MEMLQRGVVRAVFRLEEEVASVRALLAKYSDVPMDLADPCLVRMTEIHAEAVLVTVDAEFRDVYRRHGRKTIPTQLPDGATRARQK